MCYSAQVLQDYRKYVRAFGADISLREFFELFWRRTMEPALKIPKAMEAAFLSAPQGGVAGESAAMLRAIREQIDAFTAQETVRMEQALFAQRVVERGPGHGSFADAVCRTGARSSVSRQTLTSSSGVPCSDGRLHRCDR